MRFATEPMPATARAPEPAPRKSRRDNRALSFAFGLLNSFRFMMASAKPMILTHCRLSSPSEAILWQIVFQLLFRMPKNPIALPLLAGDQILPAPATAISASARSMDCIRGRAKQKAERFSALQEGGDLWVATPARGDCGWHIGLFPSPNDNQVSS